MKKIFLLFIGIFLSLIIGCSPSMRGRSPIVDGLTFTYRHHTTGDESFLCQYTFKERARNEFAVTIEWEGNLRTETVDRNFRYYRDSLPADPFVLEYGNILWFPPKMLAKGEVFQYEVLRTTQRRAYEVYKLKHILREGCFSYYEKSTGFLIAGESFDEDGTKLYTILVSTNAEGL
jgi:hypothetical protein